MTETLHDGRHVRLLTIIDEGNREGLGETIWRRTLGPTYSWLLSAHGQPNQLRTPGKT